MILKVIDIEFKRRLMGKPANVRGREVIGNLISNTIIVIVSMSQEKVKMKEGCLSYPFIFLNIERSRKCVGKYEDADGELKEAHLDGYMSRIFQHEYEHTQGKSMIDGVSKFRFDLAKKKAEKLATKHARELQRIKREKDDKSDI